MDFVSTVLSLSQKHDKGADSGRASRRGREEGEEGGWEPPAARARRVGFGAGRKEGTRHERDTESEGKRAECG